MNDEIKSRIEQIKKGELPEGYKKTKVGIVPNEWETKKFVEIFNFISTNTYSRADMTSEISKIKNIHYGDVLIKYNSILDCQSPNIPYLKDGLSVSKCSYCIEGDIIIADTAEDDTVGKVVELINVPKNSVISGLHTFLCRPKIGVARKWFGLFLNNESFHKQIVKLATGTKVSSITKSNILKTSLCIPPLPEQQKIAEILTAQDKVIELKEKLIAEKEAQKKYLMQNLLTGKKRLKGFSGEWKKVKFEDVFLKCSFKKHQINSTEYLIEGEIPVVDQGKTKIIGYSNDFPKIILCPKTGLIIFGDHTRELKFIDFNFIIGADGTQVLVTEQNHNTKYIYYFLCNSNIPNTGYNRHFKFVKELNFSLPPLPEQNAIAEILSTADREIELLKAELDEQKQKKKALMQLLLTGIVRV